MFPTHLSEILKRVDQVDPVQYARTRNFKNGAVSRLSPYISRGVISTRFVYHSLLGRGYTRKTAEKYIQELAWRDYWQLNWKVLGDRINHHLRPPKYTPKHFEIPSCILSCNTGIEAVDSALNEFYESGYMHNHMRMYVASIICSIAKSDWLLPAQWMYYHLLDADWASNALSWQWVAGTNSNKMYFANQDNINKYWSGRQKDTFLDFSYDQLLKNEVPKVLLKTEPIRYETRLPERQTPELYENRPTLIYNNYNLDPFWRKEGAFNRILLLEPSLFQKYPIAQRTLDFILRLSRNINGIQVFVGEFRELEQHIPGTSVCYFKEHPLSQHYKGIEEPRDWMFEGADYTTGSFFKFWKSCLKTLNE